MYNSFKVNSSVARYKNFQYILAIVRIFTLCIQNFIRLHHLQVKEGQLATAEGLSYLETKNILLLQYIMHLTFYFLLRAEGRSVKSHPVISRLVEIRTYLEKIRPIDKKLQYQINKLLTSQQLVKVGLVSKSLCVETGFPWNFLKTDSVWLSCMFLSVQL